MKRICIYGMGQTAKKLISIIKDKTNEYQVVAITDSYVETETVKTFLNFPVKTIDDCLDMGCEYIVICVRGIGDEIKNNVIKLCGNKQKVITMNEFLLMEVYVEQHTNLLNNNELYRFYYGEKHTVLNKWIHYFDVYKTYFEKFKNTDVVVCEVGVFKGGSMQMWSKYFGDQATIIGIDIDEECRKYERENIHIEIGSQEDEAFWQYIKMKYPRIDILLDDGGHTMCQQITTFKNMFEHIRDGGIYMCEDCHTSYWESYGGGIKKQDTFIEYAKNFIDDINAYHWKDAVEDVNYNTRNMVGLHYYDSMVVIEKRKVNFPFDLAIENEE